MSKFWLINVKICQKNLFFGFSGENCVKFVVTKVKISQNFRARPKKGQIGQFFIFLIVQLTILQFIGQTNVKILVN